MWNYCKEFLCLQATTTTRKRHAPQTERTTARTVLCPEVSVGKTLPKPTLISIVCISGRWSPLSTRWRSLERDGAPGHRSRGNGMENCVPGQNARDTESAVSHSESWYDHVSFDRRISSTQRPLLSNFKHLSQFRYLRK